MPWFPGGKGASPVIAARSIVSIHIAPAAAAPMQTVAEARVTVGKGIEGDRYYKGEGTFSRHSGAGREVTLIEIEAIEAVERDYQINLTPVLLRRNLVTRGVPLNHLVNREFMVGDVRLRGERLCEPCAHLEALARPGVMRALVHRGGLRAGVVTGGVIRAGDVITIQNGS